MIHLCTYLRREVGVGEETGDSVVIRFQLDLRTFLLLSSLFKLYIGDDFCCLGNAQSLIIVM